MKSAASSWRGLAEPSYVAAPRRRRRLRFRLLDLYLIRGVAGPFAVIVFGVAAAMMLERALRLIQELAASGADLGYFLPILLQLAPYYVDLAIPASFMVALVLLVARLDDSLELEAVLASGVSLGRIAAPLVALGVLVAALDLMAGGWLEPLGRYGLRTLRAEAINAGEIGRLEPRALYHPADSFALTFDERAPGGRVSGIFVWQRLADGGELVLTGRDGRIGFAPQARAFVVDLGRGLYVAERPRRAESQRVAFDSLAVRESLRLRESSWQRGWDQREMTISELGSALRSGTSAVPRRALAAELYAGIARAALIPFLPLLVLPLAMTTKKGRRGLGIVVGGVLLAAFHHGMNFAKHLSLAGTADPGTAILGTTAVCAAIVLLVFLSGRKLPSHSPIHAALKPFAGLRPRLRSGGGAGQLAQVRRRTLAVYLNLQLAKWVGVSLVGIVLLLQMVALLERGEALISRGFGAAEIGRYVLLQLPLMLQQALPIAALTGAVAAFVGLARSSEMTAIRAAGVSQWRILAMTLPVPLLLALASYGLSEQAVPRSQLALAAWWAQTEPAEEREAAGPRWFRVGDEIVQAQNASPDGSRLVGVDIFRRDQDGLLAERISAAAAVAGPGGWTLEQVERRRIAGGRIERSRTGRLEWRAPLQAQDVAAFFASVRSLSAASARRALGAEAPVSGGEAAFATRILRSAAEPLAPLVMLLLALPLAFVPPRTGVAWPALLYAGGGGLLYIVADGVLTVFAQVGYLPAAVGAWTAPAIAVLTGVTVLLYSER